MAQAFEAVVEETRELARIVAVDDVLEHPNAERLSIALIGGWQCCIKLNEFKKGDLALYVEIDSLVPTAHPSFTFLEERTTDIKSVGEITYSRISTAKFRKELSQGLLIPVPESLGKVKAGDNVTKQLGVLKYERVAQRGANEPEAESWYGRMVRFISGDPVTNAKPWPSFINKSEQNRVQNIGTQYSRAADEQERFEKSIKLNGQSMSAWCVIDGPHFGVLGVASRNNALSLDDVKWAPFEQYRRWLGHLLATNRRMFRPRVLVRTPWNIPEKQPKPKGYADWRFFEKAGNWLDRFLSENKHNKLFTIPRWRTGLYARDDQLVDFAYTSQLFDKLAYHFAQTGQPIAVQGELCGPGIQSNHENFEELRYFVYNVFVGDKSGGPLVEMLPGEARRLVARLGLEYIPLDSADTVLPPTIKQCLAEAKGTRHFAKRGKREGVVYKSLTRPFSFKVIDNDFLLDEEKEEARLAATEAELV